MCEVTEQSKCQREAQYEDKHVHQVYNSIASHFSSTRFKPWPVVDAFLRDLPSGAVGLDIGCGNGKYLSVRQDIFMLGSDRSSELLKFAAQHSPHDVAVADALQLPHPNSSFDFAVSIAVVHHLSTRARRQEAVKRILQTLRPSKLDGRKGGEALIFVWALEQKGSRRGWDIGDDQDVLVPWVLKGSRSKKGESDARGEARNDNSNDEENSGTKELEEAKDPGKDGRTFQRYYHLYRQGELEEDIMAIGGVVVRNGYDRDNCGVCTMKDHDANALPKLWTQSASKLRSDVLKEQFEEWRAQDKTAKRHILSHDQQ